MRAVFGKRPPCIFLSLPSFPPSPSKVCAVVSDDFLRYSKARGNDLMTPRPEYSFPGLKVSEEGEEEWREGWKNLGWRVLCGCSFSIWFLPGVFINC